jgi:hypothetical protein
MDCIKAQVLLLGIMDASVGLAMWLLGLVGALPSAGPLRAVLRRVSRPQ